MSNLERIREAFPDNEISYMFCEDYDDEVVMLVDKKITSVYDYLTDLNEDNEDYYQMLYEGIKDFVNSHNSYDKK